MLKVKESESNLVHKNV